MITKMASAISNALGITIFPTRKAPQGSERDGFDEFLDNFPEALAAQLEVTQSEETGEASADWYVLVPRSPGGLQWLPVEKYGASDNVERLRAV